MTSVETNPTDGLGASRSASERAADADDHAAGAVAAAEARYRQLLELVAT